MNTIRMQTPADAISRNNTAAEMKCLVKDSGVCNITYAREGYIYIIENTVNERSSREQGYFLSLGDAVDAIKKCCDWYRSNGTGKIYRITPGLCNWDNPRVLVWEN
ncbi:MAG: hypothetical protein IJZ68_09185 [Bacteroidaceae bacterium]|nr:hypothetical protein [Bacteroidaceae bacterium]